MDSQIAEVNQSLTTAEQMRNQNQLIMQPYANWEDYLSPAPFSIAIMAELAFLSSKTDFSINKNPPKEGYKYIKYPDSFCACLMQVCNSGWWAFNEAHTNMDQIRLLTLTVPNYMMTVVKILFQGNNEVVKDHLPNQLTNIRGIADRCLELANSTKERFEEVINIIHELLEVCLKARNLYGEELDAVKRTLDENKLREESSKEAVERSKKAVKVLEEELKEARESYKSAMRSLPGGWEMMAMDLVGSVTDAMTGIFHGITMLMTQPVAQACKATTTIAETVNHIKGEDSVDPVDRINIYSKSAEILKCTELIEHFVQEDKIDWFSLYDQKNNAALTEFPAMQFKRIMKNLEKLPKCQPREHAKNICKEGIMICKELAKYAPDGKCDKAKTLELIERIKELTESAYRFDSKSKDVTKSPPLTPKPPMMFKEESKMGRMTASQKASKNARFRIEETRAQMNKSRELYDKNVESMERNQKELNEILVTLRNCQVKEIDFNTTIQMLVKGLDAMGKVKKQWEKMVQFFQMVSNIVKNSLNLTLNDFATTAETSNRHSYDGKLFCKDMLYNQAFQATNIASLVHMISSTYTDVSTRYLMDSVSSLGTLMSADPQSRQFLQMHVQLRKSCDMAQNAIKKLVLKNKEEFDRKTDSRLKKIEKELLAILPAAKPEEIQFIQETAQSGFTEEEQLNYV
ncbi:uncharacterized protein LOC124391887 [Silurus meridionalis]|uniref:uncharacterized protein LOC124391887 n=1 Tax=Silurus meridionalis TaxID=175797 RepID=UPI001EEAAF7B|nr:uncharacterized protein LOC124391887 [Silurus meridionalis]